MKAPLIGTALLAASAAAAFAAPPPGHPAPDEASRLLGVPRGEAKLPYEGLVVKAVNSNNYTYIQVRSPNGTRWLAVPRVQVRPDTRIRYGRGRVMHNFYSRKLHITFPSIMFVDRIQVEGTQI